MKRALENHFWIVSLVLFSVLGFFSYGFVKDLFFWLEDYQIVYSYFAGIPYYFWPYQGLSIIYGPFAGLFDNNPQGYFIVSWVLLILSAFTLEIFVWKLSRNKLTALIAGLIFVSGYTGAGAMMLVSVNIVSNLFLILLLIFLMNYENLFQPHKRKWFWFLYLISFILFTVFSHRAHILPFLIIISEWYWHQKNKIRRVLPFMATAILVYAVFPLFLATKEKHLGQISSAMILNIFNKNFWLDMWNLIFPSELISLSPQAGVILGIVSLIVLAILSYKNRPAIYLALSTITSYIVFHLFEYNLVHPSWHRYFFYSYAFFSAFLAVLFTSLFISKKWQFVLAAVVIASHLYLVGKSDFVNRAVQRGHEARKFFSQLKESAKEISSPTLFYFDSVADPPIVSKLNSILSGGVFPAETAIAAVYKTDIQNIKIAKDYDEFNTLGKSKRYTQQYFLFYNRESDLENLSAKPNSAKQIILGQFTLDTVASDQKSIEIKTPNFPAYKPILVKIEMRATLLPDVETPKQDSVENTSSLAGYLVERDGFQKSVEIRSNGSEFPGKVQFLTDGDPQSSWFADKMLWRSGEKPWIEFGFPKEINISEVRWLSSYPSRLPVSYRYQVQNSTNGNWESIFSVSKLSAEANKYHVDKINKISAKKFRVVIDETSSNEFPAISEFEILSSNWNVDSGQANYVMLNPTLLNQDLGKLINNFNFYLSPITDKYWSKFHTIRIPSRLFIDGKFHSYEIEIPPGGTSLGKITIDFPKLPLRIKINSISLR